MAYCTITELKNAINKTTTTVTIDAVLTQLVTAAERNINRACQRPDGFVAVAVGTTRKYAGLGNPWVYIDECISVSAVGVKDSASDSTFTAWAATDYVLASGDPRNPNYNLSPYTLLIVDPTGNQSIFTSGKYTTRGGFRPMADVSRGAPTIEVTARWGYAATVPDDIKTACIMQAARWYKRLEGAMSDALTTGELGTLFYTKSLDPDIKRLLVDGRYVRPGVG